jgi:adenosine deaminase
MNPDLIRRLPKTDLHVHLDGSLRLSTLIDLARSRKVALPSQTEEGLYARVFRERYRDLPEYLEGFQYTVAVLQDAEALERVAFELCEDAQAEGVRYLEIRFAPQLHVRPGFELSDVVTAVDRGIRRAAKAFNDRSEVVSDGEPPFAAGMILCALRFFAPEFSTGYRRFFEAMPMAPPSEVYAAASLEVARAAARLKASGLLVVGIDLAGQERGYPAEDHRAAYQVAHEAFLGKTVHAGEDYGPESIFQAIGDCHADRIGHGTWLFDGSKVGAIHEYHERRSESALALVPCAEVVRLQQSFVVRRVATATHHLGKDYGAECAPRRRERDGDWRGGNRGGPERPAGAIDEPGRRREKSRPITGSNALREARDQRAHGGRAARVSGDVTTGFKAHLDAQVMSLDEFLDAVFAGRFRYGIPLGAKAIVRIQSGVLGCWKCGVVTRIVTFIEVFVGPHRFQLTVFDLNDFPDLLASCQDRIPKRSDIGVIKPRYSATLERSDMSNGCYGCDALIGAHFEHDAWYNEEATLAEFQITISERWVKAIGSAGQFDDDYRWGPELTHGSVGQSIVAFGDAGDHLPWIETFRLDDGHCFG